MPILQLHVELLGVRPRVWRRIEVRSSRTFWDLHCAIQDAMGWKDCHLHQFTLSTGDQKLVVGIPDQEFPDDEEVLAGWETRLADWHPGAPMQYQYWYDFGDDWLHTITLEKMSRAEPGMRYPRCTAGERRCPPEDVGGAHGYAEFLASLRSARTRRRQEVEAWIAEPFDPEEFDAHAVRFSNPTTRLKRSGVLGEWPREIPNPRHKTSRKKRTDRN
jgi:Plasmid pRiA4b ORF-3-like protein.